MVSEPQSNAGKPTDSGTQLGQVMTPSELAKRVVDLLLADRPASAPVEVLDAGAGPGTFGRAAVEAGVLREGDRLTAFEIDPVMAGALRSWAQATEIEVDLIQQDFLTNHEKRGFDYAVSNPPYLRQEWITGKERLRQRVRKHWGVDIPGTANMYVYFTLEVISAMRQGGRFAVLIYDSWEATLYGQWLSHFLNATCEDIKLVSVGGQPFHERLIDATIVSGRVVRNHGPVDLPAIDRSVSIGPFAGVGRFVSIEEAFETQRGLRLKQADFFMCPVEEVDRLGAEPFVKKPGRITGYSVPEDHPEAVLLVAEKSSQEAAFGELRRRLSLALKDEQNNRTILNWYRERPDYWYRHKPPPYAPLIFSYYLRGRPRHLYNPTRPYADNFYGAVPRTGDPLGWLAVLNSSYSAIELVANARNQGSGLRKLQLFEYRRTCVPSLPDFPGDVQERLRLLGLRLAATTNGNSSASLLRQIDHVLDKSLPDSVVAVRDEYWKRAPQNKVLEEVN